MGAKSKYKENENKKKKYSVCMVCSLQSAVCSLQSAVCSLRGLRFGVTRCVVAWTNIVGQNFGKVSSITIANHLKGCGKKEIGETGYKFFSENYIHNVFVKEEDGRAGTCEEKGRC